MTSMGSYSIGFLR